MGQVQFKTLSYEQSKEFIYEKTLSILKNTLPKMLMVIAVCVMFFLIIFVYAFDRADRDLDIKLLSRYPML